jgi:hypothetical protein
MTEIVLPQPFNRRKYEWAISTVVVVTACGSK